MAQIYSTTKGASSSGYGANSFTYRIRVNENSTSIPNNTGNYTIYFDVMPVKSRYQSWTDNDATFRITTSNGQSINADSSSGIRGSKTAYNYNSYSNIASWTGDLTHANDGSLTITVSITYGFSSSDGNYLPLSTNISGTATATNIPRYSDLTCATPVDMGSTQTITVVQKSTSFSHILYYKTPLMSDYVEIGRKTGQETSTYSWAVPNIATSLPSANSSDYTLLVRTYLNTTYDSATYLDTTKTITANVPASYVPTVAITSVAEGNTKVPSTFPYIVGYSKLKVSTRFTGSAGSTLKERTVRIGNETIVSTATSADLTSQFQTALTATTNTIYASVKDSRDRTGSASQNVSAYAYQTPNVQIDYTRSNASGGVDALGTYLQVKAKWFYDSVNSKNSATIKVYLNNVLKYTYTPTVREQSNWTNITLLSGIATTSQYDIKVVIEDLLDSATVSGTVAKATVPMSLYDDGTNIGASFGRMATSKGWNFYDGDLTVDNGNVNISGVLRTQGRDIELGTLDSSSNDSGDLVWRYGNGQEKMRIWSANTYTTRTGPNFRVYNSSGSQLYSGRLPLLEEITPSAIGVKIWETLWEGTLLGRNTLSLDVSAYSKLKIYAMNYYVNIIFELDLTKTTPNQYQTGYPYMAGGSVGAYAPSNIWEIHHCMFGVSTDKKTVYTANSGYSYNSTNTIRNNNAQYYVYKIEGMR